GENFLVQIVNSRGEVINISSGFHGKPLPMRLRPGRGIMVVDGHPFAYVCRPTDVGRGETGYLLVAQSLKQATGFLGSLGRALFLAGLIGLSMALAGGYFIARRALKPVGEITAAARSIGSGDLSRRIPLSGPKDELYNLAETFNSMLARLEQVFKKQKDFLADASHELRT
ncbi:MAG: HAMP domain-containing protein, partial [Moorella sp. (in: Bacteria)]|nr:HAMP domain-containing protein [Moorella sp. (in: firmicutes)]